MYLYIYFFLILVRPQLNQNVIVLRFRSLSVSACPVFGLGRPFAQLRLCHLSVAENISNQKFIFVRSSFLFYLYCCCGFCFHLGCSLVLLLLVDNLAEFALFAVWPLCILKYTQMYTFPFTSAGYPVRQVYYLRKLCHFWGDFNAKLALFWKINCIYVLFFFENCFCSNPEIFGTSPDFLYIFKEKKAVIAYFFSSKSVFFLMISVH